MLYVSIYFIFLYVYITIQLVWVPGHMGIDWNKIADQLARQGSPILRAGPEPALGMSAKPILGGGVITKHKV